MYTSFLFISLICFGWAFLGAISIEEVKRKNIERELFHRKIKRDLETLKLQSEINYRKNTARIKKLVP